MGKTILFEALKYLPHIVTHNQIITEANYAFSNLTGYEQNELLGINVTNLQEKIKLNINIYAIQTEVSCFLFTKYHEVREVTIIHHDGLTSSQRIYIFLEKPNSRLEDKFPVVEQLICDNIYSIAIYSIPDMILLKANEAYYRHLENPYNKKENCFGSCINEIIPDWQESHLKSVFNQLIFEGKTVHINEYTRFSSLCNVTYWNSTFVPIFEGSVLKYCIEISINITESVMAQNQIKQQSLVISHQNQQLEAIVENISDVLYIVDRYGNRIKENKKSRIYSNSNFSFDNLVNGKSVVCQDIAGNTIPPDDLPVHRILRGEELDQFKMAIYKGDRKIYFSISGTPVFNENNELIMGVICYRDITDQVRYEESIKKQRDILYKIINTLDLPIIRLSYPKLSIIEINKKAYESICSMDDVLPDSASAKAVPGESIIKCFPDLIYGEKYRYICEMEQSKNAVYVYNVEIIRNGYTYYFNFIYQPLLDCNGNIVEVLIIAIDVTHEVRQKKALEKTLKMKEEFFSFVSHEFKTPLTVINAAVQALETLCRNELSEKAKNFIKKIRQNSLRQLRLVNNLLDITKIDSGYMKLHMKNVDIVSITKAITESVSIYANEKKLHLEFISNIKQKIIAIDDEKYERILLNLLSNAIKFTPENKYIRVSVLDGNEYVRIIVEDEGIGIPKDKQNLIFERFVQVDSNFTRTSEGTGIGLSLVKLLVTILGGKLDLVSEEGVGSKFIITLPLTKVDEISENDSTAQISDNRLIQAAEIEFSDIYLT